MYSLNGLLSIEVINEVNKYTDLRFTDRRKYVCAEALSLYEQKILPNDDILSLCEKSYDEDLYIPASSYIPNDILNHFRNSGIIPVSLSPIRGVITCIALPELGTNYTPYKHYKVEVVYTPIYNYFQEYVKHYGKHKDLQEVPAKQILDSIVNEAISIGASDITIASLENTATVYYNVRKNKVYSQRILTSDNIQDIIKLMCFESPMDVTTNKPKYVGISLNDYYRGRVCINRLYHGYSITVRLLPNAAFDATLESLNITKETINFLRNKFMNKEFGLRLIAGSTMSGKNTTALACLSELAEKDKDKIVSIEMPVEQILEGIIQINAEDEEEYEQNINSLLRQNPDFIYITEMGDTNSIPIMRVANTGKRVMTTIHANSCADVIGRLVDITGLSIDRILQSIHSIVYQELVRDNDNDIVTPKNKYVYLTEEKKNILYGKPFGEVVKKLKEWEAGDIW